jgi:hypothetical protein
MTFDVAGVMSIDLGPNRFPSDPNEGIATLTIEGEYKVDVQKPHGKDDPTIKGVGKDARHIKLVLQWTTRIEEEARAFIKTASPLGPNAGHAWETTHPDCDLYFFDSIQLTKQGEIARTAGDRTITFEGLSWKHTVPVQSGAGAKTAKKADGWTNPDSIAGKGHTTFTTSSGNVIDMGAGPVAVETSDGNTFGFGSGAAPKAKVP